MTVVTHDASSPARSAGADRRTAGLVLAVVSAVTFGISGAVARGLLETGWSAGALVLARIGLAAVVLAPAGLMALRGRWQLLHQNAGLVTAYGLLAVGGAQFCYFAAVSYMQVGPALLIEYTAPGAVVAWLWLRRGERPGRLTVAGAAISALGLILVLDLLSGADLSPVGVLWALGAMIGAASHFLLSARADTGLPPVTLASGGLVVATVALGLLAVLGWMPVSTSAASTTYAGVSVAWWVPLVLLGPLTAAVPYTSGIAAARRLGSRLASFVGLLEVVAAIGFAWVLLAELPGTLQLLGGLLVLAGVVAVRAGEQAPPR